MILLNNIFFNTIEYNIISKNDTYDIKIYDISEKLWYGSNMKLTYDIKYNKNIFTILINFDINNFKINTYDIIESESKNLFILFNLNEIFFKKNIHIFSKNNMIVVISNEVIDYILEWLCEKNIYMPDVIYTAEHEYVYNFLQISKKIVYLLKTLYNLNFTRVCVFNTNIYYLIQNIYEDIYDENIIMTNDIDKNIFNDNDNCFYIKMKNNNVMKNKNVLKELFNMNFYI